jgi:hypothetical protein
VSRSRATLPPSAHYAQPWRVHEITGDFRLEDVWALPAEGSREEFPRLLKAFSARDSAGGGSSRAAGALMRIRLRLGEMLHLDDPRSGIGSRVQSLRERLPADVAAATDPPSPGSLAFQTVYQLPNEWAAEIANRTMHGVLHLGWVPVGDGRYRGQMAILVKPNGLEGRAYMAAIRPFRHLIVYPSMLSRIERVWNER